MIFEDEKVVTDFKIKRNYGQVDRYDLLIQFAAERILKEKGVQHG